MSVTLQLYSPFPTLTFLYCIPFSGVTPWINHLHKKVHPFCMGYGGFAFAQGEPYHGWEPIWMLWWVMQQVLHPGIAPCKMVVVLKNNERVLQTKNNVKFCMKFWPFLILFINMVMSHTHLNSHVDFSTNLWTCWLVNTYKINMIKLYFTKSLHSGTVWKIRSE